MRGENAAGLPMSLNAPVRMHGGFDYTGAGCIEWMSDAGFTDVHREYPGGSCSMAAGIK